MGAEFDTDLIPAEDRFPYYREVVLGSLYRMTAELGDQVPEDFRVSLVARQVADAVSVHCRGSVHHIGRTRRDIAAEASDCYFIFEQMGDGPVVFESPGMEAVEI